MNGQNRADVKIGAKVSIVLKADQRTTACRTASAPSASQTAGWLTSATGTCIASQTPNRTEGVVARLLTNSNTHPHGIKVMLEDGQVGRVQEIL